MNSFKYITETKPSKCGKGDVIRAQLYIVDVLTYFLSIKSIYEGTLVALIWLLSVLPTFSSLLWFSLISLNDINQGRKAMEIIQYREGSKDFAASAEAIGLQYTNSN